MQMWEGEEKEEAGVAKGDTEGNSGCWRSTIMVYDCEWRDLVETGMAVGVSERGGDAEIKAASGGRKTCGL